MLNEAIRTEVAADSVSDILKTIFIPPCPAVVAALLVEARGDDVDFNKIIRLISGDLGLGAVDNQRSRRMTLLYRSEFVVHIQWVTEGLFTGCELWSYPDFWAASGWCV